MRKVSLLITVLALIFVLGACAADLHVETTDVIPPAQDAPTVTPGEKPVDLPAAPLRPSLQQMLVVNTDRLNIRSAPDKNSRIVGRAERGDVLGFVRREGDWYATYYLFTVSYVHSDYVNYTAFEKTGTSDAEKAINIGIKTLGTPYILGAERLHWGNGMMNANFSTSAYDCSSLMQYMAYYADRTLLDVTSRLQSIQGKYVGKTQLIRGDLMFFTNSVRDDLSGVERIGHVGMYLGDNYILHTATDYAVIEKISAQRWSYFINGRRIF